MARTTVLKGLLFVLAGLLLFLAAPTKADWPMSGANPQRTSWVDEEVKGTLRVNWYRSIEAFIQGKVNLVAANDRVYISTARGLIILNYNDGSIAGRFDTQIPLGNAPTIVGSYAYVPGLDRTIYKLNALDASFVDSFAGAKAGFHGNPLVINDSYTGDEEVIFVGSRDGFLYAIDADTMNKLWQYPPEGQPPLGPIAMSPAYNNGVIYFVANNTLRMYAIDTSGSLLWVSAVLQGMQYQSYWPVIYQDKIMVFGSPPYSHGQDPGTATVKDINGTGFGSYQGLQAYMMTRGLYDTMPVVSDPCGTWHHGQTVYDGWRYSEYYENNPEYDFYWHKPWRRLLMIINSADGSEYTCDVDSDGFPDYAPIYYHGTRSGNASPPLVGPDDVIYFCNYYNDTGVSNTRMMGWLFGTRYLSSISTLRTALDEPTILSGGGTVLYRVLCCDREAVWADVDGGTGTLWSYSLPSQAPGYGIMWFDRSGESGLWGGYANVNGIYHDHGDQNPLIPYNGKLYVHRSNCIICYGSGPAVTTPLPLVEMNDEKDDIITAPTADDLKLRLESEIQKMVDAGNLKPGYYNKGQAQPNWYINYFTNPGETLHVLTRAYPYIDNPTLKTQLEAYLQNQWSEYFSPTMYAQKGYSEGAWREDMDYPPELADKMATMNKSLTTSTGWGWTYPQSNFYAIWKYVQIFPAETTNAYNLAKSKITLPPLATDATMLEQPWIVHGYIAGYYGFLQLQTLAGKEGETVSGWTRAQIQNELNRLKLLRVNGFEKDTPWNNDNKRHWKRYNVARNFMWLTPELGDYMYQSIYSQMKEAMDEYNWVAAYWFLSRFEADTQEGCMSVLDTYHALFQGKAYALKEPYEELTKYLDAPAFPRGDLFYIDNLITAIGAPHAAPEITPNGGGTYIDPVTVEIAVPAVPDANIYYSLDGSEPNSSSTLYTAPFVLSSSTTVKTVAYYADQTSGVVTAVFTIDTGLTNQAPVVNAGGDQEITLPTNTADLVGSYIDSTLTFPPAAITTSWSQVTGPDTVIFDDANELETTATFSVIGVYTLRLSVDEIGLIGTDDVVITVLPKPNEAPVVDAGPNQQIVFPSNTVNLDGTVTDDGLPDPPAAVTVTWTMDSGPGIVTFGNANAVDTAATFSTHGVYVLRLAADDSELTNSDTVTITVASNSAPIVSAGNDQVITLPTTTASLNGIVTDDGLPNPPAVVTQTWTKQSGPGTATFADANVVDTTVTFSVVGVYVLHLTADDSELSGYDEVTITLKAGGGPGGMVQVVNDTGFENDNIATLGIYETWDGTTIDTWFNYGTNYFGEFHATTGDPHSGTYKADLDSTVHDNSRLMQVMQLSNPTVNGGDGTFECWIKGDIDFIDVMFYINKPPNGNLYSNRDASFRLSNTEETSWTYRTLNFTIAGEYNWAAFRIVGKNATFGYCYLDDVTLQIELRSPGDFDADGDVDAADLKRITDQWLWTGTAGSIPEDIVQDGQVDLLDFTLLADAWLE